MTIHLDPTRKLEAIDAGFDAYGEELAPHRNGDAYRLLMNEWNPVAVCDGERVIGSLISKDNVIHLAIIPSYRGKWASRRIIQQMLRYGTTTTVAEDNAFVERIGFRRVGDLYEYKGAESCRGQQ
jgi:GNAT superfamily N-acetyltransferase